MWHPLFALVKRLQHEQVLCHFVHYVSPSHMVTFPFRRSNLRSLDV